MTVWYIPELVPKTGEQVLGFFPERKDPYQTCQWVYVDDDGSGPDLVGGLWIADGREENKLHSWSRIGPIQKEAK